MLSASGRHPWRAAHLHFIVRALGFRPVTTHVFDDGSRFLESDTVFGVKPSLVRRFQRHEPGAAGRPEDVRPDQVWYSLTFDFVLRRQP
jgi:protocatechuate 3,4-dioxygenase beta subunit